MPIFCATLIDLVFFQDIGPVAVRLEQQLADFADGSARRRRPR